MNKKEDTKTFDILPRHVGIIMDGNGRWAKKRGLPRSEGHKEGAKVFRKISQYAGDIGIENVTFYAFSTENWKRPKQEVEGIMDLFRDYLEEAIRDEEKYKHFRIRFIGDRSALSNDIIKMMDLTENGAKDRIGTTVNLAVNYGGRAEILDAVREIAQEAADGKIDPKSLTEDDISGRLYTAGQADPDLIIRPSGERRLSNFMIWQAAYAEFWSSDVLWPDFTTDDFDRALEEFAKRNRRFGGI